MHGTIAAGELTAIKTSTRTAAVHFEIASPRHDAGLRRLLRENPMRGRISLSLEREPSYFAAAEIEGVDHQTIIALKGKQIVCAGGISSRRRYINGAPMRVGYLGGLRMDASCRGQASIIRRGYELFRQLHEQTGPAIYLTSIVADNLQARRLLERGLKGMPTYRFLGEFVTVVIRVGRTFANSALQIMQGSNERTAEIMQLLNRDHQQYQFAPVWTADEVKAGNFGIVYSKDGTPTACAALWDQRAIKQTVVRGYSNGLRWARPLVNLLGRARLPRVGQTISHAFVSHLAVDKHEPEIAEGLIQFLSGKAGARKIDYLTVGFDARDPRLAHLRKIYRPREYASRIYAVHWQDGAELAGGLDDRLLAPEVAIL